MSLAGATLIGAGLSFIGGAIQNSINRNIADKNVAFQREANEKNLALTEKMNSQNIAFQQNENAIARAREDNAVQRAAADMQAAGLSKTLAAGNPASAASMTAPSGKAGSVDSLSNNFKYESAFQKMNIANLMLDMAQKSEQLKINDALAQAQIDNMNAQTKYQNTVTENYAKDKEVDWAYKESMTALNDVNQRKSEAEANLYEIEGNYRGEKLRSEIDESVSRTMMNYSTYRLNAKKIEEIAQNISESIARENKLNKEVEKLIYDITKAELEGKVLQHDLDYAERYGLPVGQILNGNVGAWINGGRSLYDQASNLSFIKRWINTNRNIDGSITDPSLGGGYAW